MSGATYRVLFQDVLSGYVHGELPVEVLAYTNTRNSPGSASITIALDPGVSRVNPQTLITGAATAVYIERGSRFVWSGLVWDASADFQNGTLKLDCEGWLSYYRLRGIHTTRQYIQWDQADIARDLLRHAATYGPGSKLGMIEYGTELTGVKRDRTYKQSDRKPIGEAITQLSEVANGFDFSFGAEWTGENEDDLVVRFRILYPTIGRDRSISLVDGQNCDITGATIGGKSVRTFALAAGAGDGPEQLIATTNRPSTVFPRLEDIATYSDVKEIATLKAKADQRLRLGGQPIVLPTIELYPNAVPGLDLLDVGDQVQVSGGYGLVPISGTWRVVEISVTVDENGGEDISLTVAPLEVFQDA